MSPSNTPSSPSRRVPPRPAAPNAPEPALLVDPAWLLKAVGVMVAVALVLAYVVVCALFYQAQWQLVLHPSRVEVHRPAEFGLTAEDEHLGPAKELRSWWIPAAAAEAPAVLMLPSGDGEASALLGRAHTLHEAGFAVLLLQYRGFGASAGKHPTEQTMQQDAEWALSALTATHAARTVLVYASGTGASLAVHLCAEHHEIAGLVLEAPQGDFAAQAAADTRARLVPFRLLFNQEFALADPLAHLPTPKLLVSYGTSAAAAARSAGDPKMLVELPSAADETSWQQALRRFLDSYVPQAARAR